MRTWFFYSVPGSTIPSPYFKRVPPMLADLSRKGILRFRLWQGSHEAPVPLEDRLEPVDNYKATELPKPILPVTPWPIRLEIGAQA